MSDTCRNCSAEIPDGEEFCAQCTPPAKRVSDGSLRSDALPELPPRYEIIRSLGRGGMGRVFLCRDTNLDVEVAIKVLPPELADDEHALEEIRKEARLSARLRDCPGVIVLYGFETYGETNYLVMEYAPNGSLRDRLKVGELIPEKLCRKIGLEILRALAHAHQRKVLHRDIKPANVLFDRAGRARLADFGLAKVLADASTRKSLRTVAGTPSYIPPEIIDQQQADGRADLYSLGCMLYEMSTGVPPFKGTVAEVLAAKLVTGERGPPDPKVVQTDLTRGFSDVVRKLMEVDPADRYPDAESAFAALRARSHLDDQEPEPPPPGIPPPPDGPTEKSGGGRRKALVVVAALLVAALLVTVLIGNSKSPAPDVPDVAEGTAAPPAGPAPGEPPDIGPLPLPPPLEPPPATSATLLVYTDPPGATVSVDGIERGVTGEEGLAIPELAPGVPLTVTLSHPGCEPAEESSVVLTESEERELRVTLVRKSGTLRFRGGVSGTAVWAKREGAAPRDLTLAEDGTLGPVPFEFGDYEMVLSKHGYHTRKLSIRVEVGKEKVVDASLTEEDGRLTVRTDPPGAEVFSGETLLGTTPLEGLVVPPGTHEIRLDHPDRDPVLRKIEVHGEQEVDLGTVVLPPLAVLDLRGIGDGVTAKVDGRPVSGLVEMRSGRIEVELSRENHYSQTIGVDLRSGETSRPEPGEWRILPGRIDLSGQPEDVTVLLDGRLLTDVAAPIRAEAGTHRVDLFRADHRPIHRIVEVEPEETATLGELKWSRKRFRPMVRDLPPPPETDLTEVALPPGVLLNEGRIYWEKDDAEMVVVPGGTFVMGSDSAEEFEKPAHEVTVSACLLDRHEVTNEQFARFVRDTDFRTRAERDGRNSTWRHRVSTRDRNPVVNVCYEDARAYAKWAGKRLPTEAEFAWALRGGWTGSLYPWGDAPPGEEKIGNFADRSFERNYPNRPFLSEYDDRYEEAAPVGSFPPNPYGLFDITGNLWEWVADWFSEYPAEPQKDPTGPSEGSTRILRGGSWASAPAELRCTMRVSKTYDTTLKDVGFRCAVSLPR